jgi:hypothetical protein
MSGIRQFLDECHLTDRDAEAVFDKPAPPWSFSEEAAPKRHSPGPAQYGHPFAELGAVDHHRWWKMVVSPFPWTAHLSVLVSAEKKFGARSIW